MILTQSAITMDMDTEKVTVKIMDNMSVDITAVSNS